MRYFLTLLITLTATIWLGAQTPTSEWLQVRNPRADQPASAGRLFVTRDMAKSPWGAMYLTGYSGRADTARLLRPYSINGNPGFPVGVFAPSGDTLNFVWGTSLAFTSTDVFVSGLFEGVIRFDENNIFRSDDVSRDAFLASYSPSGRLRWARSLGDNFEEKLPVIGMTNDEQLLLALRTADTLYRPIEIRSFDRLGNRLDSVKVEHAPAIEDLKFDKEGNLYLAGKMRWPTTIGGSIVAPVGNEDFYITKYGSDGVLKWLVHAGTTGECTTTAVEVDEQGNMYFSASFGLGSDAGDTLRFGDSTYLTTRKNDMLIGAIDSAGNIKWSKHIYRSVGGYSNAMRINDIAAVDKGLFMAGSFMDGSTIIGDTTIRTRDFDPVVLKFGSEGDFHWVARAGTDNGDEGLRIAPIDTKKIFVAGVLNDLKDTLDATFGNIQFTVSEKFVPFLAILEDQYVPPLTAIETGIEGDWDLFPNPARDYMFLRWAKTTSPVSAVTVYDLHGRRMRHYRPKPSLSGEQRLDLSGMPAGLYVLRVKVGEEFWIKELQKLP